MKIICSHCKSEIKGNIYTNREVRLPNQALRNFHATCFPIYWAEEQKQRQQAEMTKRQLRLMVNPSWNGAD